MQTTFRSLRVRNFRLFFVGQLISSIGLWMQQIAELWLIFQITDSAAAVGLITVTHFAPIMLLGLWGGVIADRFDKRKIMLVTQPLLGLIAGTLAVFSATGGVTAGLLYGFSAMTGLVLALDNPTRRAFVRELVEGGASNFRTLVITAYVVHLFPLVVSASLGPPSISF